GAYHVSAALETFRTAQCAILETRDHVLGTERVVHSCLFICTVPSQGAARGVGKDPKLGCLCVHYSGLSSGCFESGYDFLEFTSHSEFRKPAPEFPNVFPELAATMGFEDVQECSSQLLKRNPTDLARYLRAPRV